MGTSHVQCEQRQSLDSSQSVVIRIDPESTSEDVALFAKAIDELHRDTSDGDEDVTPCADAAAAAAEATTTHEEDSAIARLKFVDTLEQKVAEALARANVKLPSNSAAAAETTSSNPSSFWCSSTPTHSSVGSYSSHDTWASDGSGSRADSEPWEFSTLMSSHLEAVLLRATGCGPSGGSPSLTSPRREPPHDSRKECDEDHAVEAPLAPLSSPLAGGVASNPMGHLDAIDGLACVAAGRGP